VGAEMKPLIFQELKIDNELQTFFLILNDPLIILRSHVGCAVKPKTKSRGGLAILSRFPGEPRGTEKGPEEAGYVASGVCERWTLEGLNLNQPDVRMDHGSLIPPSPTLVTRKLRSAFSKRPNQ